MSLTSLYPVLMSNDVATCAAFFTDNLGFDTTFANDWYVSLVRDGFELAVLAAGHETIPTPTRGPRPTASWSTLRWRTWTRSTPSSSAAAASHPFSTSAPKASGSDTSSWRAPRASSLM